MISDPRRIFQGFNGTSLHLVQRPTKSCTMRKMLISLLPLLGLPVTGQNHVPSSAVSTAVPSGSGNTTSPTVSRPNLIPPPPLIPNVPNNRSVTITNACETDIWPALLTTNNTGPYTHGFYLPPQKSLQLWVSHDWTGRIWARTNCTFNESTNAGPCFTGSCGNVLNCNLSGVPPTTLVEFNLLGWQNLSYWDISLVNGFNLPVAIYPSPNGPKPICQWSPDSQGIKHHCPEELIFYADAPKTHTQIAGCMSACDQYGDAKYCCTGRHAHPNKCGPSRFSKPFKQVCPDAYTYAYDDATSTFTTDTGPQWSYEVIFCPRTYYC